ncbi:MAG: hypothetical protein MUF54_11850 [Polyangiaceae bacterium]|jgi:hypothetical protein|nr:hypothetical protein [Polyangiaceae bacterium]
MSREDLKDIIARVVDRLQTEAPKPACLMGDGCDNPCDTTTRYAIGEEA